MAATTERAVHVGAVRSVYQRVHCFMKQHGAVLSGYCVVLDHGGGIRN
jgi:hypothetical protein